MAPDIIMKNKENFTMKHARIPDRVSKGDVSVPERLKFLDKTQLHAVLATEAAGQPYTSLIAYALTPDMKGVLFITPKFTRKYKNIMKNSRVSLLIDTRSNTKKDYMSAEAVTILGNAVLVRKGKKQSEFADILIKKHPGLREIIHSPETAHIFVEISACIHVTQFQSVSIWNIKAVT
jgi:heme iron utilization protein